MLAHLARHRRATPPTLVQLKATNGAKVLTESLRLLDAEGLEPTTIAVREPSLDDVFLALTGHAAEAGRPRGDAESTRGDKEGDERHHRAPHRGRPPVLSDTFAVAGRNLHPCSGSPA